MCAALVIAVLSLLPFKRSAAVPNPSFVVRNYGGKCLDFGAPPQVSGSPVFLYTCNGTIAQQVRVIEPDPSPNSRHTVLLFAGTKAIGVKGNLNDHDALELEDYTGAPNQVFELDGDSIMLSAKRDLVVKPEAGRGANRTRLVIAHRELGTAEFWTFSSPGNPGLRPTNGFVRVPQDTDFITALRRAKWGTVIEIAAGTSIDLTTSPTQMIPAGVTIRGDRRGVMLGPELFGMYDASATMFETNGEAVRITGLRLRGPSPSTAYNPHVIHGIVAHERLSTIIDNNELSDWPIDAISVVNIGFRDHRFPRSESIRILHNFIHHNQGDGLGYGVDIGDGAFAEIDGNVFVSNRHAIASGGADFTSYRARYNLVLFAAPGYGWTHHVEHDFDVHGVLDTCGQHCGGQAGDYFEIAQNTFLGGNRFNFRLRGTPTREADFHDNVLVGSRGDALKNEGDSAKLIVVDDRFDTPNPTARMGVGDFDGDQKDDLFLATGAAWYFAPAANAEWRFLSGHREPIDQLMFGDFDGDGRTDVLTVQGSAWLVSWGGTSEWEKINDIPAAMSDLAIGDFDGDHRADVLYANGKEWLISSGGSAPLQHFDTSGFRISDLRFGDFNGDGKTDIFGITGNHWSVTYGGTSGWVSLPHTLSDSVNSLIVADLNGDRKADLLTFTPIFPAGIVFKAWYNGTADWTPLRSFNPAVPIAGIGRFRGNRGADLLLWDGLYLDISTGVTEAPQRQSRQDMK